jgi:hypothetical protein
MKALANYSILIMREQAPDPVSPPARSAFRPGPATGPRQAPGREKAEDPGECAGAASYDAVSRRDPRRTRRHSSPWWSRVSILRATASLSSLAMNTLVPACSTTSSPSAGLLAKAACSMGPSRPARVHRRIPADSGRPEARRVSSMNAAAWLESSSMASLPSRHPARSASFPAVPCGQVTARLRSRSSRAGTSRRPSPSGRDNEIRDRAVPGVTPGAHRSRCLGPTRP